MQCIDSMIVRLNNICHQQLSDCGAEPEALPFAHPAECQMPSLQSCSWVLTCHTPPTCLPRAHPPVAGPGLTCPLWQQWWPQSTGWCTDGYPQLAGHPYGQMHRGAAADAKPVAAASLLFNSYHRRSNTRSKVPVNHTEQLSSTQSVAQPNTICRLIPESSGWPHPILPKDIP